jgi:cytochrome P450
MFGALGQIRSNTTGFLADVHQEFGDVAQFPVPIPAISLNNPADVDYVLRTNAKNYTKNTVQYGSLKLVTGDGLLTSDGAIWRAHRRALQPAFHRTMQSLTLDAIRDSYDHFAAAWRSDGAIEISEAMQHLTLEVVGRSLFGASLSGNADAIAQATLKALKVVVARARTPFALPSVVPTPNNLRLRSAINTLDNAVAELLAAPSAHPDAFITLLREAHEADPVRFNLNAVRDEIVTFIVAGHETVASALTWTLQLLNEHSPAYGAIQAEARSGIDVTDLEAIPLARAAFAEALRLYPPAWLITRESIHTDEIGDLAIPEGTLIIMSPYLLHRGDNWENAEVFDIKRFADDNSQVARADYLPFGLGSRMCIGRDMALVEGPVLLASLLRDFDVVPTNNWSDVGMTHSVTLHPTRRMEAKLLPAR